MILSSTGKPVLLGLAALLLVSAASADELSEVWFEVTLGGASVGYSHEIVTSENGQITTTVEADFTMRRGGELVTVRGVDEWIESSDLKAVSLNQTRKMAKETQELEATVAPSQLRLRTSDGNDAVFGAVPLEGEVLFPRAIEALRVSKGFRPGTEYTYSVFDTDFADVGDVRVEVVGPEELEILGETRRLTKLRVAAELYGYAEVYQWVDAEGRLWREEFPAIDTVVERTTSEIATREVEARDILTASMISSNVSIPDPTRVDDALFELWLPDEDISELIIEDGRQIIEGRTERGVLLRVKRTVPASGTTIAFPVRSTPLKDYLEGNAMMQTWYPRLLGTAARAVWEANQDTWLGAKEIERWAFENVEDKGMGTAFASAREVLERLSGDCSEHAVIMTAMVRAVQIPGKISSGVVHYNGKFAYHMWVEVWTGDGWYALDPTIGQGSVDATHIKFAESSVPGGRVAELSLGIMRVFNRLGVRVVEYTVDGEAVRVSSE